MIKRFLIYVGSRVNPLWVLAIWIAAVGVYVYVSFGPMDYRPTADDFVRAQAYCKARGLIAVGLSRPINGTTAGIGCETFDGRSWFFVQPEDYKEKR